MDDQMLAELEQGRILNSMYTVGTAIFNCIFAIELIVRISVLQLWFVVGPDLRWNILDVIVVASSVITQFTDLGSGVSFIRVLKGFRVIKVMRIIRVVRVFHELRVMVCSIASAMASLTWAFFLLF